MCAHPSASDSEESLPPHNFPTTLPHCSSSSLSFPYDLTLFPGVVHQGFPGSVMSLAYAFDILPAGTQKAASKTSPQSVALSLYIQSTRMEASALLHISVMVTQCECKTKIKHLNNCQAKTRTLLCCHRILVPNSDADCVFEEMVYDSVWLDERGLLTWVLGICGGPTALSLVLYYPLGKLKTPPESLRKECTGETSSWRV